MKFREIFRFEISYLLKHFSTWLLVILFFLFGFIILRIVTLVGETYYNAPGTIAFFTVFGSVIWVVIGGGIAGEAATRDIQTRMHPLCFTTPVKKITYLGGRFIAALVLNTALLIALYAGLIFSLYGPGFKSELLGPFRIDTYLSNFGFLVLPAVIATTAIQFTFAALSGRAIAGYIASIAIIIFSQLGGTTVMYALEWKTLGGVMDLLGTSIIAEMEGWTPLEKNTRLVQLEGIWMWNRLVWFSIAAAVLILTYFRFNMSHIEGNSGLNFFKRRRSDLHSVVEKSSSPRNEFRGYTYSLSLPERQQNFGFATWAKQAWTLAKSSFRSIATSRAGLTLVALLAIGTGLFATEYMEFYGVPLYARTEEVLRILTPALSSYKTQWILIPLLIIFYASELVWRERDTGINELYDTAPVPEATAFLGKFLGLAMVIAVWMVFLIMAGIINQLVMGYYEFELLVYIKAIFGFQFPNYLLFAVLVLVVHVLVDQKYLGLIMALGAYGYILFAPSLGIEHKMLIYTSDTGWAYSDMNGFDPFIRPWLSFKIYWAAWALLFSVIAILFWVRSKEGRFKERINQAGHRLSKYKPTLFAALIFLLLSGAFVFYNTNVLNEYLQKEDYMETRAEYERNYGQYKSTAQPYLTGVKLNVEIYPDDNLAEIRAVYYLENRTEKTIDTLHFTTIPREGISEVSFNRAANPVVIDDKLGYRIYSLEDPLKSGDALEMYFLVEVDPEGFSNEGVDLSVVENGSHIKSEDWMPIVGFDDDRRIYDEKDREKYKLPARPSRPSLYDVEARNDARHARQINFEAVVGTVSSQIAVTPGALKKSWTEDNRRYFHYVTNAPIHNYYAIFSADYAVREEQWVQDPEPGHTFQDSVHAVKRLAAPVNIQIFFHPEHHQNIDRMMQSIQASMKYFSKEFGPYPYSHFRVIERPGPGRGAHADPMTIDYASGFSLMNPQPEGLDLPYHIMAHEVAHQWWGLSLSPAVVEGSAVLVESLATYSAMQVVEDALGYDHLQKYLSQMRQEYEVPRSRAAPPLLRANNRFMNYRKGPFAFYALRNYIGKDKVNDALRAMLEENPSEPPLPTTLDLYRELQSVTPDSLQYLVKDLIAENTFWELKTREAHAKQIEPDKWQVTLVVDARKVTVDSIGKENEIQLNDWIEVGVSNSAKELYLKKHQIKTGSQIIIIYVSEEPGRAGIDPNHLLMDINMSDNTKKVKIEGGEEDKEVPNLI